MATLTKRYPLNAKAIKSSLKKEGFKVFSCKKGVGTTKNATYIYVDYSNVIDAVDFLRNIGVVDCLGNPLTFIGKITKTEGACYLGACYMDELTFNELNEYKWTIDQ